MRGIRIAVVSAFALAALLSPTSAFAATGGDHPVTGGGAAAAHRQATAAVGGMAQFTLDSRTHEVKLDAASSHLTVKDGRGNIIESTDAGAKVSFDSVQPATSTSYNCVIKTDYNSQLKAYTPGHWYASGNSYSLNWDFHPYSVDDARYVSGAPTFQVEMCFTGGGTSWNSWHQWYNGGSTTANRPRIGYNWATGVSNSTTSSTLNFQVNSGPVTIGASTTITPGVGSYSGSTGYDSNAVVQTPSTYDNHRVNAFFVSPHNWTWDGTGSFEGNNGHALWETREGNSVTWWYAAGAQYFCAAYGTIYGNSCSSLH